MIKVKTIMELKAKIKMWCKATGKKPYHLTELSDVHHSIIYRYLNGKDMLHDNAMKIERAINRDLSD